MTEFLYKEIVADVIGAYLLAYRETYDFRREYEPARLAKHLTELLTQRERVVVQVISKRSRRGIKRNKNTPYVFLVDNQCLVMVIKVVHLRSQDLEDLEKQLDDSELDAGLVLNFGSRRPEFWRAQKNQNTETRTRQTNRKQ